MEQRLARLRLGRIAAAAPPWAIGVFYAISSFDWLSDDAVVALIAGLVLSLVVGALLRWRYERPELVTAGVLAADALVHLLIHDLVIPFAGLVVIWSLARSRPPKVSLIGLAGLLAVSALNFFTATVEDAVFTVVISVCVWALGEAARNRRTAIEEATRRAVSDEQARIARELHDVIAHSVSVIVVQASAARDIFDARPDQARAALRSIEDAGRDALRELRLLLSPVRPHDAGAPQPPQPGLDHVEELAAPMRTAGLQVVVTREGVPCPLPAGVDLSAYRIVQEALTNTLRHARATLAEVTFRYGADAVEIEVVDDGRAAPARVGGAPGYGLIGMRERAALVGGTLEAGPTTHGGYRVHARLPIELAP